MLATILTRPALPTTLPLSCYCLPLLACLALCVWYASLPGETEAGSAGEQPDRGIARPTVRQGCILSCGPRPRWWSGGLFPPPLGHRSPCLVKRILLLCSDLPPCRCSAFGVEHLLQVLHSVAPPPYVQHHALVQQSVQYRRRQGLVPGQYPRPVLDALVRRDRRA